MYFVENLYFNHPKFLSYICLLRRRRLPSWRPRPRTGARITGRTDRVGARREISDISVRRIEAVKFICRAAVRRVRPLCHEGNNNDTLYVHMWRTVAVSRHTMPNDAHKPSSRLVRVSLLRLRYTIRYTGRCYLSSVYRLRGSLRIFTTAW